ncbi:hypothetical protein ACH5RR_036554 [Cinchona calisaya]|uniref:DDE Tnp4 domain-containing protein n=1 Tax=Cinchona calisaya TaxID=153742 RepID=A0ABD2Y8G0_9GENT
MIIGAATSSLAAGYAVLEAYRTPIVIPRPPHINRDQARENYMDSILYGSSSYSVPSEIQERFRGRMGIPTQNVLATISFDLKFSYVLVGWEGSAHDSRILENALSRPRGLQVPKDAGYGIRNGLIPPYIGVRNHLKEYDGNPPQNEKELFNLRHSSLRTTIERGFGILKKRFRVVDNDPFWDFKTQVDVVLVCCILHNHIMDIAPNDRFMQEVIQDQQSQTPIVLHEQESQTQQGQT